ncbi:Methionine ABC transporter ATP-binding protein [Euzebya pacifica]|uniref:Methionine ABC transporter ATP-binding protein n=1 Tax=Euzebya pacifica TaxID=1608957 RepID=A0A346XUQ1_9ACTN|nr:Methionine ABC transporter ATP-binding protein [Euzebya pacifica]
MARSCPLPTGSVVVPEPIIRVEGITKSFGDVHALRGVDLEVAEGTVLGLLGPNGAGKTTLVRVLTTLLQPTSGRATVAGLDVVEQAQALRSQIGLAGQYAAVDGDLTGRENLVMVGRLYRLGKAEAARRADEVLERISLTEASTRPVKTYSGGMRRRLDLAASLVGRPRVLFLDEPTTGLDPRSRIELWQLITELVGDGTSLLLTTQYLEEADQLADRIAVIDHGSLIAEGTADELKATLGGDVIELRVADPARTEDAAAALAGIAVETPRTDVDAGEVVVPVADGATKLIAAVRALDAASVELLDIQLRRPTLDEVFLTLTADDQPAGAPTTPRRPCRRPQRRRPASDRPRPDIDGPRRQHLHRHRAHDPAQPAQAGSLTAAGRVLHHPADHVRAAVQLRLRWGARDPRRRQLHQLPPARHLRPDGAVRVHQHRDRPARGPQPRNGRPVQVPADGPLGGARGPHDRGLHAWVVHRHVDGGRRLHHRLPLPERPAQRPAGHRVGGAVRPRVLVDQRQHRPAGDDRGDRPDRRVHLGLPAGVRLQRLRAHRVDAGLAPGLRQQPARHDAGQRRPWPRPAAHGSGDRRADRYRRHDPVSHRFVAVDRRAAGGLHPAGHPRVPPGVGLARPRAARLGLLSAQPASVPTAAGVAGT